MEKKGNSTIMCWGIYGDIVGVYSNIYHPKTGESNGK